MNQYTYLKCWKLNSDLCSASKSQTGKLSYRVPGISITVWYFCGKVAAPPPTSIYSGSCEMLTDSPVLTPFVEAGVVDEGGG